MRKYFITGLLVLFPIVATLWVVNLIIKTLDKSILLLPIDWRPELLIGYDLPGLGTLLTLIIIFFTGVITRNYNGEKLIFFWEQFLKRIPIVSSVYYSVKQVSESVLLSSGNSFRRVLLIQYPREKIWTIAFQTGTPNDSLKKYLKDEIICVYVPTTPNPTSGFLLMLKNEDVIELDMSVEQALKYIISLGVVSNESKIRN